MSIKRVALYVLFAVLLLISTITALLGTATGTRVSVSLLNHFAQPMLQIESVEGVLLRDVSLQGVAYQSATGTTARIEHIDLRWRPWQLLRKQLHIRQLKVDNVQVTTAEAGSDEPESPLEWPIVLPDIVLNFSARFDHVSFTQVHLNTALVLQELNLRGRYENNSLRIHNLSVVHPQFAFDSRLHLSPQSAYPLTLELTGAATMGPLPETDFELTMDGALLETFELALTTNGGIQSRFNGTVNQLLSGDPAWRVAAQVSDIKLPVVQEQVEEFVVQFEGQGGIDYATGDVLASAFSDQHGRVTLSAEGRFSEQRAELSELAIMASEYGFETHISGYADIRPNLVLLEMTGDGTLKDYPGFNLAVNFDGDFEHARSLKLVLDSESGALGISGNAAWQQAPEWDLSVTLSNLDLAILPLPQPLQGALNTTLRSQGLWGNAPEAKVTIDTLNGNVLGEQLQASGTLNYTENTLTLRNIILSAAETEIKIAGTASREQLALDAAFESKNLSRLYADIAGSVTAAARIEGTLAAPTVALKSQGEAVQWKTTEINNFNADLHADQSFAQLPTGVISFDGLRINQSAPLSGQVQANHADNQRYTLKADITGEDFDSQLELAGRWQNGAWEGVLEQLQWRSPALGRWLLQEPVAIQYTEDLAMVEPFCVSVSSREARLCGGFKWEPKQEFLQGHIDIDELSFSLLQPWLPSSFNLDGALSVSADYSQQAQARSYQAVVQLTDTRIALPEQDISLWLSAGELFRLTGNEQKLDARVSLTTDAVDGSLTSAFAIERPFANDREIMGEAALNFQNLAIVSLIAPQLQNVSGELRGDLSFAGPVSLPNIGGSIELMNAGAEVASAGLNLTDLNFALRSPTDTGEPFTLSGSVTSGQGSLALNGNYNLNTHIADLNVTGSNFTAMQSREISLTMSPDLQLRVGPNLMRLRGSLAIPQALITPPDFESVSLSSRDTIVVRGEETVWQNASSNPYDIDIQVSLGENVQVQAYGFDGSLGGRLRIIEQPGQETTAVGNIDVQSGRYAIYGQEMTIERGRLVYTGGVVSNPGLDLRVTRRFETDQITVGARVGGSLQEPTMSLFSTPTLQDAEILSYLVLGRGFGDERDSDQNMLLQASLALGMQGGNILGERLSESIGVDEIMLDGGDTLESTSLFIGKHLSPRLYVRYGVGLVEPVSTFFIRYRLTDYLNFETQTGTLGSGADLFYTIER